LTKSGKKIFSTGIIIWVAANQTIEHSIIENNYITDVDHGITLGAHSGIRLNNNQIRNNIVYNSEVGIRLNCNDANVTSVYFNTLVKNDINILLNSGGSGYRIINNISDSPGLQHIQINEVNDFTVNLDFNLYAPDNKMFFYRARSQTIATFQNWKKTFPYWNMNSVSAKKSKLKKKKPKKIRGFRLKKSSKAINAALPILDVTLDLEGNDRLVDGNSDIGALEFNKD